jgi:hypothetical protein
LAVDEAVKATARVVNRADWPSPMVMLELPVPAGFAVAADDLAALLQAGAIAKFQAGPRNVLVYLRDLPPGKPLKLSYRLRATMPAKVAAPPARAYEYYDPDRQGHSAAARLTVKARQWPLAASRPVEGGSSVARRPPHFFRDPSAGAVLQERYGTPTTVKRREGAMSPFGLYRPWERNLAGGLASDRANGLPAHPPRL